MGLMDILNGIDLKDIAMGMAVASNGDTAVPTVLNILDKQRKEQEAKDQARNTSNFIQAIYASQGNDPTAQILAKQRTLNAMPDTTTQYDTSGIPAAQSGEPGSQEAAYNAMSGGGITTQEAPNLDKAKASIDFAQQVVKARDSIPNVADAIAKVWPQFQDKNLDPQLVSSAFAHLYSVNEKKVEKLITIMDKQQAREDAAKTKQEEFQNKVTNVGKPGEWYSQGGVLKQIPGEAEPKTDAYNVAKRMLKEANPGRIPTDTEIQSQIVKNESFVAQAKEQAKSTVPTEWKTVDGQTIDMAKVPEEIKRTAKMVAEYKFASPGGFALRSPYWQQVIAIASQINPDFDSSQWNVKYRLRQDFTSGKAALNIRSINTVVAHLETLQEKAKALNNGSAPLWNTISNYGLTQTGDPRVVAFNNAATAVENELASVFKGTGAPTDQEVKQWRSNLNSSQSPEQIKAGLNTAVELMGGRIQAMTDQYERGLGQPKDFKILSDKSRTILNKIGVDVNVLDPVMPSMISAKEPSSKFDPILSQYFPPDQIDMAKRVMTLESGGKPEAMNTNRNMTQDSGLFQINDSNIKELQLAGMITDKASLKDPETNIKAAAYLFNKYGWKPWSASIGNVPNQGGGQPQSVAPSPSITQKPKTAAEWLKSKGL
jgi:hypothetical protein